MQRMGFVVLSAVFLMGATAQAQSPAEPAKVGARAGGLAFTAEASIAQVADLTGAELGVGARYAVSGLRLTGLVGGFVHANQDDRYRSETFANGNTVCRDTASGRFADDANCAPQVAAYGKLEASWLFENGFEIGAGARFSEEATSPYGTLGYAWPNGLAAYAAGGEDYVGLGLAFRR